MIRCVAEHLLIYYPLSRNRQQLSNNRRGGQLLASLLLYLFPLLLLSLPPPTLFSRAAVNSYLFKWISMLAKKNILGYSRDNEKP
jgi:hypothetical protein